MKPRGQKIQMYTDVVRRKPVNAVEDDGQPVSACTEPVDEIGPVQLQLPELQVFLRGCNSA